MENILLLFLMSTLVCYLIFLDGKININKFLGTSHYYIPSVPVLLFFSAGSYFLIQMLLSYLAFFMKKAC